MDLQSSGGEALPDLVAGLAPLWNETLGDPRVAIAVLDGPVDVAHPCFVGTDLSVLPTLVGNQSAGGAARSHGTMVASLLFARHDGPLRGIAPRCKGLVAPVFGDDLRGEVRPASQVDLGRAIRQALGVGASIINVSGGELVDSAEMGWPLGDAIEACDDEGVLVVAAAGNEGCACIHIPAASPSVLVVGAMGRDGSPSRFSNFGATYKDHGILAPGEDLLGATHGGGMERRSGTSYAVPIVSGVAALLMSRELRRGRTVRSREVFDVLLESAVSCEMQPVDECARLFRGRLNVVGAVRMLDARVGTIMVDAANVEPGLAGESAASATEPVPSPSSGARHPQASESSIPTEVLAGTIVPAGGEHPAGLLSAPSSSGAMPADCGCSTGSPSLVFAIGTLGFDFGNESLRDIAFDAAGKPIYTNEDLCKYLKANPPEAETIIWTLRIDSYPVYAIRPSGPFADQVYSRLVEFLEEGETLLVSLPGRRNGATVSLLRGDAVLVIEPDLEGLSCWSTEALVTALFAQYPLPRSANETLVRRSLENYLARVYYEWRNAGVSPPDRALNFSATNVYSVYQIMVQAVSRGLELQSVERERSPLGRPESDCWDLKLTFFDPLHPRRSPRQAFRFTVDVSDVEPVQIGDHRTWQLQ